MFSLDELLAYFGVAALLVVVPGPNSALILAQTLEGGRRAGLATVAGVVQFFVLGAILSLLGGICGAILALAAGQMVSRFAARMAIWRWQRRFTGMVLVGLGLRLIWVERH